MLEKPPKCSSLQTPCVKVYTMSTTSIGSALAISGSFLSILGTLVNNIWLDHTLAMGIWMFSNPILFAWAYGNDKKWWDGGLSIKALAITYAIFTITNFYGLFFGGLH
jgi:hypothetical protein